MTFPHGSVWCPNCRCELKERERKRWTIFVTGKQPYAPRARVRARRRGVGLGCRRRPQQPRACHAGFIELLTAHLGALADDPLAPDLAIFVEPISVIECVAKSDEDRA